MWHIPPFHTLAACNHRNHDNLFNSLYDVKMKNRSELLRGPTRAGNPRKMVEHFPSGKGQEILSNWKILENLIFLLKNLKEILEKLMKFISQKSGNHENIS